MGFAVHGVRAHASVISSVWLIPALLTGLIALVLTTIAWPISALVRRHYGALQLTGRDARRIAASASPTAVLRYSSSGALTLTADGRPSPPVATRPLVVTLQLLSAIVFFRPPPSAYGTRSSSYAATQMVRKNLGGAARAGLTGCAVGRAGLPSHCVRHELLRRAGSTSAESDALT